MKRARPYHKRWHGNALNGMRGLSLEERGAYNTLLDLMYDHQAPIADDERRICGELDCDIRVWRRIKTSLAEKGKIYVRDGLIGNERVDRELGSSAELPAEVPGKSAIATRQLSAKSDGKPKENNEPSSPKNPEIGPLIQSPESIPPKAPRGAVQMGIGKDDVDAIWSIASPVSRQRSGRKDVERALQAAVRRGHHPSRVLSGLKGYFASPEATRDGGQFAKGVHRMIEADRWEVFAEPVAAAPQLFDEADPQDDPWRRRVREFQRNGFWNQLDWGPKPGRPGCAAPADLLAEFDIATNLLAFPGRPAA